MSRPDRHNEIELNLLTTGSLTYLLGGKRTTIEAGRLSIFWAAIPHQIVEIEGDTPYFVATLPLGEFLRAELGLSFVNRVLQGELKPLTSQSIAEAMDVHANDAMTLFRKTFGTTMTAFIIQHRISHAQRLLVTTDEAILNVALDSVHWLLNRCVLCAKVISSGRNSSANRL